MLVFSVQRLQCDDQCPPLITELQNSNSGTSQLWTELSESVSKIRIPFFKLTQIFGYSFMKSPEEHISHEEVAVFSPKAILWYVKLLRYLVLCVQYYCLAS